MSSGATVDSVLVQWGERLFYPSNRIVKPAPTPRLETMIRRKAAVIRRRIEATVIGRAPQVMVKVTGGGRSMAAIAAHFRYISKNGRLEIENDRGVVREGKEALHDQAEQWRYGGSLIDEVGHRREAFNIMLSMPNGTDARMVQKAAREFAQAELPGHRYVMVLREHQANPHVHLSVRAESRTGKRLNPRKTDLLLWRETFAEKLRGWGVEAEATRQATRGESRNFDPLWRVKAKQEGRLRQTGSAPKTGQRHWDSRAEAMKGWAYIIKAGWRQLPWPVDDNYLGRLKAASGLVREAGLPWSVAASGQTVDQSHQADIQSGRRRHPEGQQWVGQQTTGRPLRDLGPRATGPSGPGRHNSTLSGSSQPNRSSHPPMRPDAKRRAAHRPAAAPA